MSIHNIHICGEIRNIYSGYTCLSGALLDYNSVTSLQQPHMAINKTGCCRETVVQMLNMLSKMLSWRKKKNTNSSWLKKKPSNLKSYIIR